MLAHAIVPWLHLGTVVGGMLLLFAALSWRADQESAAALAVIGAMILAFVAVEHGVAAYYRG